MVYYHPDNSNPRNQVFNFKKNYMTSTINNFSSIEGAKSGQNTLNTLENTIAGSVHAIVSSAETAAFSIKGESFTIDSYVKNILLPLSENKS